MVSPEREQGEERRSPSRLPEPVCPQCQGALVAVMVRKTHVVCYRCVACDETWDVPKPIPPAGELRGSE